MKQKSKKKFFLLYLDFGSNGHFTNSSSYTHLKPSLMLNETLSSSQDGSNIIQAYDEYKGAL